MRNMVEKITALLLTAMMVLSAFPTARAEEGTEMSGSDSQNSGIIDTLKLERWLEDYVQQYHLSDGSREFSVGFCYTGTGDCWYYNADVFLYSASLYKVPVSMLMAEKEAAGELTQDSQIYGMTLQYLESTALIHSNNESGHAMVDYLGGTYDGKCSDMTIPYTDLPESYFEKDFFDYSYYTARYMTQVMKTLYEGGETRFPHVIENLLKAQPDSYFNISLRDYYSVAQKYGAFGEMNGNDNNHCAAIIYTPTPIIVTVMTRNVGEYQKRIAEVGAFFAAYALELDTKLDEYRREAEEKAAAEEAARLAQSAENEAADLQTAAETAAVWNPAVDVLTGSETGTMPGTETEPAPMQTEAEPAEVRSFPVLPLALALASAAAVVLLAGLLFRRRKPVKYQKPIINEKTERSARQKPREETEYRPRH